MDAAGFGPASPGFQPGVLSGINTMRPRFAFPSAILNILPRSGVFGILASLAHDCRQSILCVIMCSSMMWSRCQESNLDTRTCWAPAFAIPPHRLPSL